MKQALHIFRKDSWHLRYVIAALLAWTTLFAIDSARTPGAFYIESSMTFVIGQLSNWVFPVLWWYLVARVCHAEALPGDRQFWLTRPYGRASLGIAKALFVLVYIVVPFAGAQLFALLVRGLPLLPNLPGLLWEQVIIGAVWIVPAFVIASLTQSLVQFIPSVLLIPVIYGVGTVGNSVTQMDRTALLSGRPFDWIRLSLAIAVAVVVSAVAARMQFASRRTGRSRVVALCGVLAVVVCLASVPWQTAFAIQQWVDPVPQHGLAATLQRPIISAPRTPQMLGQLQFHFDVSGLDPSTPLACHAGELGIRRPGAAEWRSGIRTIQGATELTSARNGCTLWTVLAPLVVEFGDQPLDVRATLYVTVFGDLQSTTIELGSARTVEHAGLCDISRVRGRKPERQATVAACVSAFRLPATLVEFATPGEGSDRFGPRSYSPFPAELWMRPLLAMTRTFAANVDRFDVQTWPVAGHAVLHTSLDNVRLSDFEVRLGR